MPELKKCDSTSSGVVLLPTKKRTMDAVGKQTDKEETIYSLKQKYKDALLFEIYEDENILHSVLANRISVSASGLNAIIKKLNEVQPPPIHINKQGKFTLYSLGETGKAYVESELMYSMISDSDDENIVHNIFRLLRTFKDQHPQKWMSILKSILNEEEGWDKYEEGFGFIKELGNYYLKSSDKAENLLSLAVVDRTLQKKIVEYIKENRNFENAWEVLNYWEQEDTLELYRLVDTLFIAIDTGMEIIDCYSFSLTDIVSQMDRVLDKIQAALLQALLRRLSKEEAIQFWLEYGVEKHLAIYLAEKYFTCRQNYEQTKEERKSCI